MKQKIKTVKKYLLGKTYTQQDTTQAYNIRKNTQSQRNEKQNNNIVTTILKLKLMDIKQQRKQAKIVSALLNDFKNKNGIIDIHPEINNSSQLNSACKTKQNQSMKITKIKQILNNKQVKSIGKHVSTASTCRKQETSQNAKYMSIQISELPNQKIIDKLKIYQGSPLNNLTAAYIHSCSQTQNKRNYYSSLDKCRIATQNYDQLKIQVINNKPNSNMNKKKLFNRSAVVSQNQLTLKKISQSSDHHLSKDRKKDKENKLSFSQLMRKNLLPGQKLIWKRRRNFQKYSKRDYRGNDSYQDQYHHSAQNKQQKDSQQFNLNEQQRQNFNRKNKRYVQVSVADFMQEHESNISESISKKFQQFRKYNSSRQNNNHNAKINRDNNGLEYELQPIQKIEGFDFSLNQKS